LEPVSTAEILQAAQEEQQANLFTSATGTIVKFYSEDYTADIQLNAKLWRVNEDGVREFYDPGILPRVRVQCPRGGGYMASLPHAEGDCVLVVFLAASDAEHRLNGKAPAEPADARRHSIGYPVALPGIFPDTSPPGDASARAAGMVVGKIGSDQQIRINGSTIDFGPSATDAMALASKVEAELNKLKNNILAWTPVPNDGGAALQAQLVLPTGFAYSGHTIDVKSTLVKAKR